MRSIVRNVSREKAIHYGVTLLVLFLVLAPITMLVYGSLRTDSPGAPGATFTLRNFISLLDTKYIGSVINTVIICVSVSLFAGILGIVLSWIVSRTDTPFRHWFEFVGIVPFYLSPFFGAMAWILLLHPYIGVVNKVLMAALGLSSPPFNINTMGGIIWAMTIYFTPYMFLFTVGTFKNMDPSLEEAARIQGAKIVQTLRKITLPILLPSILSAIVIIMVRAAGQFGTPAILGTPGGIFVLTTQIHRALSFYPPNYPLGAAIGVVLMMFTLSAYYMQSRILGPRQFVTVTGKGYRPRIIPLGRWRYVTFAYCLIFTLITVVLPYAALLYGSFAGNWSGDIDLSALTLANYREVLLEMSLSINAIKNSIFIAVVGASIGVIIAMIVSYIVQRTRLPGRRILDYVSMFPIAIPGIVMAVGFLWSIVHLPMIIYGTVWIIIIAFITRFMPYGVRTTSSALMQLHPELEESARIGGANWTVTMRKITIPLLKPAIVAGWILLFVTFMRELPTAILLYSPGGEVISVAMYDLWTEGWYSEVSALGIVQAIIIFLGVMIVRKIAGAGKGMEM